MNNLKVEPRLDRKLRKRAAEIAAASKYPGEVAYQAALVDAFKHDDVVVDNGILREIRATAADGRIA